MLNISGKHLEKQIKQLQGQKVRPLIKLSNISHKTREDVLKTYRHLDNITDNHPSRHVQFSVNSFVIPNIHYKYYEDVVSSGIDMKCTFSIQLPDITKLALYDFYAINRYILLEHNVEDVNVYKVYGFEQQSKQRELEELKGDLLFTNYKIGIHFDTNSNLKKDDDINIAFRFIASKASEPKSNTRLMITCNNNEQVRYFEECIQYLPKNKNIALVANNKCDLSVSNKPYEVYKQIMSQ